MIDYRLVEFIKKNNIELVNMKIDDLEWLKLNQLKNIIFNLNSFYNKFYVINRQIEIFEKIKSLNNDEKKWDYFKKIYEKIQIKLFFSGNDLKIIGYIKNEFFTLEMINFNNKSQHIKKYTEHYNYMFDIIKDYKSWNDVNIIKLRKEVSNWNNEKNYKNNGGKNE